MASLNELHDTIIEYLRGLNNSEVGPTLQEMCEDLNVEQFHIKDALDFLVDTDVIRIDGGRYYYNEDM